MYFLPVMGGKKGKPLVWNVLMSWLPWEVSRSLLLIYCCLVNRPNAGVSFIGQ